jgi:hypothetical protein
VGTEAASLPLADGVTSVAVNNLSEANAALAMDRNPWHGEALCLPAGEMLVLPARRGTSPPRVWFGLTHGAGLLEFKFLKNLELP